MVEKIILDADICLKIGGSGKYRLLYELVPSLAENAYIHKTTYNEILSLGERSLGKNRYILSKDIGTNRWK